MPSVGPGVRHAELLAEPDGEARRVVTRTRASLYAPREAGLTDSLFSKTGFTDDLAAEAAASGGRILLLTLDELYGQSS